MEQHTRNRQYQPRPYRAPEIETDAGFTYNTRGALALVYGTNVAFLSRLAREVRDDEDNYLWSSPRLVLTLAEASDAYRNDNAEHHASLMRAAIEYCNQFLPENSKLRDDASLRLTWAEKGIVAVACEQNRKHGFDMDVVKHGPQAFVLVAPRHPDDSPIGLTDKADSTFVQLGTEREPRPPRQDRRQYGNNNGGYDEEGDYRRSRSNHRRRGGYVGG